MRVHAMRSKLMAMALALSLTAPQAALAQLNLYSREQEVQLGKQAAAEVEKQIPVLEESHPVSRYVRALGERLAANTPEPRYPYTFKVVNQKEINAFALPGGPVYINLGVIRAASNEAEVAGVMGHEIAHVVKRHGTQQATKGTLAQGIAAVLGGVLGGTAGGLAQLGVQMGGGLVLMKYSRGAESEADSVGARILYDTGYNPQSMVTFFQKLASEGGSRAPEFLSSHPNPGNRANRVAQAISGLPKKTYRGNGNDWANIKQTAMNMTPMSAEEVAKQQKAQAGSVQQVSASEVMPSSEMKAYSGQGFQLRHPGNWEVFRAQNATVVAIAPRAGMGQNSIAYGVQVDGFKAQSLTQGTDELVQGILKSNPQSKVVGQEKIRVNGVAGRSVELLGASPIQGERERDWVVTLDRQDGSLLYLVFIAPEKDFDKLRPTFENMLRSVRLQ